MSAQQKTDRRLWWLLGVAALLSVVWLLVTLGLVGSTLEPAERTTVWSLLGDRLALISLTWGAGMAAIAWGLKRWFDHWVTPSVQLAEEAQVLLRTDVVRELPPEGDGLATLTGTAHAVPWARHATAALVSSPPEKAIPTRSPIGRDCSTVDMARGS